MSIWDTALNIAGHALPGAPLLYGSGLLGGKSDPSKAFTNVATFDSPYGTKTNAAGQAMLGASGPVYGPANPNTGTAQATSDLTLPSGGGAAAPDLSSIEAAYNQTYKDLANQESQTRGQYDVYNQQLGQQFNQAQGDIQGKQTDTMNQLSNSTAAVNQSSQNAVSDARRAYNELQQRNQAYLSAGGISSSSAAEGMQAGLSQNTLSALNNITQNKDQSLQNIATQQSSVKDFYDRQIANLMSAKQTAQDQLGLQLRTALQQIDSARGMADVQKAQAKSAAFAQAQAASTAVNQQLAQAQTGLDAFKNVRDSIFSAVGGYAGGQYSIDQVNQAFNAADQKLRGSGVQIDRANVLNAMGNPYAAAQVGSNWFVPVQAPILGAPGQVRYDPVTGKPM